MTLAGGQIELTNTQHLAAFLQRLLVRCNATAVLVRRAPAQRCGAARSWEPAAQCWDVLARR